jgi:hypothetical protein
VKRPFLKARRAGHVMLLALAVSFACPVVFGDDDGGDDGHRSGGGQPIPLTVPKATCGAEDRPETGLQGQVSAALRASGFKGFNCNLRLIGQSKGEGASWQHAFFRDRVGHRCSYYDTASPVDGTTNRTNLGVVVLDVTNPRKPTPTTYLNTTAMLDPWESLKVNERRQLLGAEDGTNAAGSGQLDLYDISSDCRYPQLLSSVLTGSAANGDAAALPAGEVLKGHEGNFSTDGLTWYSGDRGTPKKYTATDISDARHPRLISTYPLQQIWPSSITTHGLSVNDENTRAYVSQASVLANPATVGITGPSNGIIIFDVSDFRNRAVNPVFKQLSTLVWQDGGQTQMTIPIKIHGKPYLVVAEEAGSAGTASLTGAQDACAAGLPAFPMARIVDISDDTKPFIVSRLMLETHNPANCAQFLPDLVGLSVFIYGSHYCSVDNRDNATTLACAYFNSGIRVFDIRDPRRPREIAYYNPPGVTTPSYGSNHFNPNSTIKSGTAAGGPDWCNAQIHLDAEAGTLQTTCQDNGFLSLKFEHHVWPFPESSTPPGKQN